VDDYVTKPFQADELLARIANLLRNRREREAYVATLPADLPAGELAAPLTAGGVEDQQWLAQLEQAVQAEIGQDTFTADVLAEQMAMSRSTLYREVKRLTGLSPAQYITEVRFAKAHDLLTANPDLAMKTVARLVGFKHSGYFGTQYRERYGNMPEKG
jgi:transcriptional regulator GlxA family with amidase domain